MSMEVRNFWKMSGGGNDFIVIDHRVPWIAPDRLSDFVTRICRRGLSVGADGLILIEPSENASYAWRFFNNNGKEAEACGNGSRCVARFAVLQHIAPPQHAFETQVGLVHAEVQENGRVRVRLPDPSEPCLSILLEGIAPLGAFINTGVPHFVCLVEDVDAIDVAHLGSKIRGHAHFAPQGTNVNFVEITGEKTLKIRTYERGVEAETLACGTGAIAAAIIATATRDMRPPIQLQTRSGIALEVDFRYAHQKATEVFLEGDARIIFTGEFHDEALL